MSLSIDPSLQSASGSLMTPAAATEHFPRSPNRALDDLDGLSPNSQRLRRQENRARSTSPRKSNDQTEDVDMMQTAGTAAAAPVPPRQFGQSTVAKNGQEAVRVVCRFRPENDYEQKHGEFCIDIDGESKVSIRRPDTDRRQESAFEYDRVFPPFSSQQSLFDHIGAPIVDTIMSGINSAVIAYGQTGTGKTFTMLGDSAFAEGKITNFGNTASEGPLSPQLRPRATSAVDLMGSQRMSMLESQAKDVEKSESAGLIPRIMRALFDNLLSTQQDFTVRASYIEIYMEMVKDLLSPLNQRASESLQIRSDGGPRGLWLPDATEIPIQSVDGCLALMAQGNANRKVASTKSNEHSSRSHAIFIVSVHCAGKIAQLYLVDLAGSEKVAKTGVQGQQLNEAKTINKSLLALGNVIFALSAVKGTRAPHVPYRDSKLTRLLQNCLGGNSRTTLVINCSPSSFNAQETLSTLRFGDRAQRIANKVTVNEAVDVNVMRSQLRELTQENARLKQRVRQLELQLSLDPAAATAAAAMTSVMQNTAPPPVRPSIPESDVFDSIASANAALAAAQGRPPTVSRDRLRADGASVLAHPSTPSFTSIIPALAPLIEDEPISALDLIRKADRPGAVNKRTLLMALTCPLSRNIMLDPVVCEDGFSYERKAITNYLRLHQVSPVTGERLSSETVLPNRLLLNMLRLHFPDALRRRSLPFFLQIPLSVISNICSFLPLDALTRVAACSRELCVVAYDPTLWRALLLADFEVTDPAVHPLLPPPQANGQMELRMLYRIIHQARAHAQ